ncbi:hypothetical protein EMIT0P265_170030 [Pseudomonas zeae]
MLNQVKQPFKSESGIRQAFDTEALSMQRLGRYSAMKCMLYSNNIWPHSVETHLEGNE